MIPGNWLWFKYLNLKYEYYLDPTYKYKYLSLKYKNKDSALEYKHQYPVEQA